MCLTKTRVSPAYEDRAQIASANAQLRRDLLAIPTERERQVRDLATTHRHKYPEEEQNLFPQDRELLCVPRLRRIVFQPLRLVLSFDCKLLCAFRRADLPLSNDLRSWCCVEPCRI